MNRSCLTCGSCAAMADALGGYLCTAERLRDPEGELAALPSRLLPRPADAFAFPAAMDGNRARVGRSLSSGSVEGWALNFRTNEREPHSWHNDDCPAWRVRSHDQRNPA